MTLAEYLARIRHPAQHQRRGQYAFNLLCEVRPDLSEQVRTTVIDPFYDDNRLPVFLAWVQEQWYVKREA